LLGHSADHALTFHYGDKIKEKIGKERFSLPDIKIYLGKRGYKVNGLRILLDKLREIGVQAIVRVNNKGFKHFIVLI